MHPLLSCSLALGACAALDSAMDLLGRDSYRIAAAAQVVLQAGRAYLALWPVMWASGTAAGRLFGEDTSWLAARHEALCGAQLCTIIAIISNLHRVGGVEPAFASSTARPATLLPWWRHITQALLDLPVDAQPTGEMIKALLSYAQLARCLSTRPAWAKHAEQLSADARLRTAVVDVLLTRSLPALAAYAGGECRLQLVLPWASGISDSLRNPRLLAKLCKRLQRDSGIAAAASEAVVSLVQALPTQRPAGVAPLAFSQLWSAAMRLTGWCVLAAGTEVGGGSSSSGGGSNASEGSGGSAAGSTAGSRRWERAPLAALPRMLQVLQGFSDDLGGPPARPPGTAGSPPVLAALCQALLLAVQPVRYLLASPPPLSAYVALLEAAAAGLRLQPLLARLHAVFQQLPQPAEGHDARLAAALLSHELIVILGRVPFGGPAWPAAAYGGDVAALAAERELHSRLARLTHWLAAGGQLPFVSAPGLPPGVAADFQRILADLLTRSQERHRSALGLGATEVHAMCASHIAAVQVAADASSPSGPHVQAAVAALGRAAASVVDAASALPSTASLAVWRATHAGLAPLLEDASQHGALTAALSSLALAVDNGNRRLAVHLAGSRLFELALECIARLPTNARAATAGQMSCAQLLALVLIGVCGAVPEELIAACTWSAEEAAAQGIPPALLQQAAAAAGVLQGGLAALSASSAPQLAGHGQLMLQHLLPGVRQAVAVLQQYWELPERQLAARLERARAAAGRSCACLRCANVAAPGGPDAGPGGGSKRCSACRAVWYCSVTCQHADWREGGHKHVCEVLGEERQRRKEEQRAQRAQQA